LPDMFRDKLDYDADDEDETFDSHGVSTTEEVGGAACRACKDGRWNTYGAPKRAPARVPMLSKLTIRPARTLENLQVFTMD
jgi:hypothetical protein